MKIAKFRCGVGQDYSYESIYDDKHAEYVTNATRISEWVEVDFPPRDSAELVPEQLARLDAAEAELRRKFEQHLNKLADERSKLLALPAPEVAMPATGFKENEVPF